MGASKFCSCLNGERIRFITLEAAEGSNPIASRRRKIGQSGAVPTAMDAQDADSTGRVRALDVPNRYQALGIHEAVVVAE